MRARIKNPVKIQGGVPSPPPPPLLWHSSISNIRYLVLPMSIFQSFVRILQQTSFFLFNPSLYTYMQRAYLPICAKKKGPNKEDRFFWMDQRVIKPRDPSRDRSCDPFRASHTIRRDDSYTKSHAFFLVFLFIHIKKLNDLNIF